MVIKKFREIDPNFQMEPFLREMRDYMLPEVLDAKKPATRSEMLRAVLIRGFSDSL
jgi:hypothetical protein